MNSVDEHFVRAQSRAFAVREKELLAATPLLPVRKTVGSTESNYVSMTAIGPN